MPYVTISSNFWAVIDLVIKAGDYKSTITIQFCSISGLYPLIIREIFTKPALRSISGQQYFQNFSCRKSMLIACNLM